MEKWQPFVGSSSFLVLKLKSFIISLISSSHSLCVVKFTEGIIEKKLLKKFNFIETSSKHHLWLKNFFSNFRFYTRSYLIRQWLRWGKIATIFKLVEAFPKQFTWSNSMPLSFAIVYKIFIGYDHAPFRVYSNTCTLFL